jgi:AraC-like DNA-binding protein
MTHLASPPSDAVSEVLDSFAVRSTIFCVSELRAPWAFRVEGEPVAKFHLVLEGSALLLCDGEAVALAPGDLVVLPRGVSHTLADDPASPSAPLEQLLADHGANGGSRLRYGGSGSLTRLLCGGFALAQGVADATLALFPDVIRVADDGARPRWVASILDDLKAEADDGRPGASAIVARIADLFLAQALRSWLLEQRGPGLADARLIRDAAVAKAVHALHERPSETWSIDRLARHVGLSRTALTIKFREQVGLPPMRYLSDVRLRVAADRLATGALTLAQVAAGAGYGSDASFAKAFKRRFGLTPAAYRTKASEPPRIEIADLQSVSRARA